jgi:hypothetical protein
MDIGDYQKKIEASLGDISRITYNAELLAAQEGRVQLELRTFTTGGTGVKDVNGKSLSKYSDAYAKRRAKAGLQTTNKDLVFSKNTSVIKDNIDIGLSDGKEREGTDIFRLNEKEKSIVVETVKNYVMAELRKMVQGWNK